MSSLSALPLTTFLLSLQDQTAGCDEASGHKLRVSAAAEGEPPPIPRSSPVSGTVPAQEEVIAAEEAAFGNGTGSRPLREEMTPEWEEIILPLEEMSGEWEGTVLVPEETFPAGQGTFPL